MVARMATSSAIGEVDLANSVEIEEVAALHLQHFPRTTEARCGLRFLARVYYPLLLEEGLMGCLVARREGRVVAFVSYSRNPGGLLLRAAWRRPVRLGAALALAALTRLDAAKALASHVRVALAPRKYASGKRRRRPEMTADAGEVLFIATRREAQAWTPPGASERVSVAVMRAAFAELRRAGARRALLKVGRKNTASNLLCHALGCRIDQDVEHPTCYFHWMDLDG